MLLRARSSYSYLVVHQSCHMTDALSISHDDCQAGSYTLVRKEVDAGRKDYQVHAFYALKDVYILTSVYPMIWRLCRHNFDAYNFQILGWVEA
jgi:hypothetical protein